MQISFYNSTAQSLEVTLSMLLQKAINQNQRSVVLTASNAQTTAINLALWTYSQGSFLPHGSKEDGYIERQPVFITDVLENPNNATLLIVIGNQSIENFQNFDRCLYVFDGNESEQLKLARQRWKTYKDQSHELTYWHQDQQKWVKQDISSI